MVTRPPNVLNPSLSLSLYLSLPPLIRMYLCSPYIRNIRLILILQTAVRLMLLRGPSMRRKKTRPIDGFNEWVSPCRIP